MTREDVDRYIISEDTSIIDALKVIDAGAKGSAFVCNAHRLLAAITDGDVRRYLMTGGNLSAPVKVIANYAPIYVCVGEDVDYDEVMRTKSILALPIVDEMMSIVDIKFLNNIKCEIKSELKLSVVIMAGGKGKRLYPYTKILPKPLIPVGDIPIAEMIINDFCQYGCMDYYMIVNHKKNMIKAYFNEIQKEYSLQYIDEDKPLGTGGGLALLKGKITDTFILTNCDVLIKADLAKAYEQHKEQKNLITMVCCKKKVQIPYGVVKVEEDNLLCSMIEKPCMEFLTNTGVYFVEPTLIHEMEVGKAVDFTDIIECYRKLGKRIGVYSVEADEWLDMGQLDEYEKMRKQLQL